MWFGALYMLKINHNPQWCLGRGWLSCPLPGWWGQPRCFLRRPIFGQALDVRTAPPLRGTRDQGREGRGSVTATCSRTRGAWGHQETAGEGLSLCWEATRPSPPPPCWLRPWGPLPAPGSGAGPRQPTMQRAGPWSHAFFSLWTQEPLD